MVKSVFTYLCIFFLFPAVILGQNPDTTKLKNNLEIARKDSVKNVEQDEIQKLEKAKQLKGFVDKNANGIDDRLENKKGRGIQKGRSDVFIDKNGDGICDGRESAIGLKKAKRMRKGKSP